jgi:hypothetical protein
MGTSYLETIKTSRGKDFRRKVGIRRRTFRQLLTQVAAAVEQDQIDQPLHRRGKKAIKLSLADKLLLTLVYLRHYDTFDELGAKFGVCESYANKVYHQYLDLLVKILRLPGKKALLDAKLSAIVLDVTEQPIERPTKHQGQYYSGKKKRHTIKAQLIVCVKTLAILLVVCGKGRTHDFALLKHCKLRILTDLKKYADLGYQWLLKLYANSFIPRKASKHHPLTPEDKQYNRALARVRIVIEHVNRRCKIFRSVKETYRGKHKNYHKVWTVVAALVNLRYVQEISHNGGN